MFFDFEQLLDFRLDRGLKSGYNSVGGRGGGSEYMQRQNFGAN